MYFIEILIVRGGERWVVFCKYCMRTIYWTVGRKEEKDSKSVGYDNLNIHYISFIFSDILNIFKM